tara:strand:+ start:72 stop:269 length:198 start_codon:yes stop_codon:yes gene_type:complete
MAAYAFYKENLNPITMKGVEKVYTEEELSLSQIREQAKKELKASLKKYKQENYGSHEAKKKSKFW